MLGLVSAYTMGECDKKTIENGVSAYELMRRVAQGVFDIGVLKEGKTLIVCGNGGNGGDGYALYDIMKAHDLDVSVVCFGENKHKDGAKYQAKCDNLTLFREDLDFTVYQNIVDCIFGIGLAREVKNEMKSCIRKINESGANIVSVDIASGLSADSGVAQGVAVNANYTIAVQSAKFGNFLADGLDCSGAVGVIDVGIKIENFDGFLMVEEDAKVLFPPLKRNVHKGNMGRLVIIAGSESFSGAAVLAEISASAFALGDGLVKLAVPECVLYPVMNKICEATLRALPSKDGMIEFDAAALDKTIEGANAVLFGNGVDISKDTFATLEYLVKNVRVPLILDADGLNLLSQNVNLLKERVGETIITPHPKEMARLMGMPTEEILEEGVSHAKEFASRYGVVVVLKGASTIITDGVNVDITYAGTSGMAKAGSGDVLAGAISALVAGGRTTFMSAWGGAYICGEAGMLASEEKGDYSMVASDTASKIAMVVKRLSK